MYVCQKCQMYVCQYAKNTRMSDIRSHFAVSSPAFFFAFLFCDWSERRNSYDIEPVQARRGL